LIKSASSIKATSFYVFINIKNKMIKCSKYEETELSKNVFFVFQSLLLKYLLTDLEIHFSKRDISLLAFKPKNFAEQNSRED